MSGDWCRARRVPGLTGRGEIVNDDVWGGGVVAVWFGMNREIMIRESGI
jgi:hypothetical protein